MQGVMRGNRDNRTYWIDGKQVSREEFDAVFPDRQEDRGRIGAGLVAFKPLESDALAVHPSQVEEAVADAKRKGVPTEFLPDGRPVFTSSRHFREYARKYGFRHRGY